MKRSARSRARGVRGTSTAEVLAGITLMLLALSATYSFQLAQTRAFAAQSVYNDTQNVTRTTIDLLSRELRMSSFDPQGTALAVSPPPTCPGVRMGLLEATPLSIRFQQDLNGDGTIAGTAEDVRYALNGADLQRTETGFAPVTIVTGVPSGGFVLRYFDNSNPPVELVPTGVPAALTASQRNCVAKVQVTIKATFANPNPTNPQPLTSIAESEVAIRNRSLDNF